MDYNNQAVSMQLYNTPLQEGQLKHLMTDWDKMDRVQDPTMTELAKAQLQMFGILMKHFE